LEAFLARVGRGVIDLCHSDGRACRQGGCGCGADMPGGRPRRGLSQNGSRARRKRLFWRHI